MMSANTFAQNSNDQKVVLITLDGFRWQELFTGADPKLIANKNYVGDTTELKTVSGKNLQRNAGKHYCRSSGQKSQNWVKYMATGKREVK